MANCFGEVVDNLKLDGMARYVGKPKTREDRAREAVNLQKEASKDIKASKYVGDLKEWYGSGASTLCVLYNATGDTLYYVDDHDWLGFIGRSPYPAEIGNGQYAAFLHTHNTSELYGSEGAVVYRGKNKDGQDRDYLIAWCTPFGVWYRNKAYCEIGGVDCFDGRWGDISGKLENADYSSSAKSDGCEIHAITEKGTSPMFHAIIKTPFGL